MSKTSEAMRWERTPEFFDKHEDWTNQPLEFILRILWDQQRKWILWIKSLQRCPKLEPSMPLMITLNWFEAHCAILLSVWYPGLDVMANADDSSAVVCLFSRDTKCATGRVRSRCGSKLFWTPKMGTGRRVKTIKSQLGFLFTSEQDQRFCKHCWGVN